MDTKCIVSTAVEKRPDHPALISGAASVSYQQLEEQIQQAAASLIKLGIGRGTRVGLMLADGSKLVTIIFALFRLGAVGCLLDSKDSLQSLKRKLSLINCSTVVSESSSSSSLSFIDKQIDQADLFIGSEACDNLEYPCPDEAVVIFTSGTTGVPKAIVHGLETFVLGAKESNARTGFSDDDRWVLTLPTSNVGGLSILFRVISEAATLVAPEEFRTKAVLETLVKYPNSWVSLVPTMVKTMFADEAPLIKGMLLGGAVVDAPTIEVVKKYNFNAFNCYGATETAANVMSTSKEDCPEFLHTVGTSLGSTSVKVVDGEVVFSGPRLCRKIITEAGERLVGSSAQHQTADEGEFVDGRLLVKGRLDRLIISGGVNIDPAEIEQTAVRHPGVVHAAVIPVLSPKWGQRPVLFLETIKEVSKDSFQKYLKSELGAVKTPQRIYILEEIPKTAIGKIHYSELKNYLEENEN